MTGTGPIFGVQGPWLPRIKGVCRRMLRASKMLLNAAILNTNLREPDSLFLPPITRTIMQALEFQGVRGRFEGSGNENIWSWRRSGGIGRSHGQECSCLVAHRRRCGEDAGISHTFSGDWIACGWNRGCGRKAASWSSHWCDLVGRHLRAVHAALRFCDRFVLAGNRQGVLGIHIALCSPDGPGWRCCRGRRRRCRLLPTANTKS